MPAVSFVPGNLPEPSEEAKPMESACRSAQNRTRTARSASDSISDAERPGKVLRSGYGHSCPETGHDE